MDKNGFSLVKALRWLQAATVWVAAWAAMLVLDGRVDLANLAMLPVLASALATLWLPIAPSLLLTLASVAAFNWAFVPPRHAAPGGMRDRVSPGAGPGAARRRP